MDEERQISDESSREVTGQEEWNQQPSSQQQPQPSQRYQQSTQPPHQQQYRRQTFTSERLNKTLGMALVLGVILLFVGGILVSTAGFIEVEERDDWNLKRNLNAVATLLSSFGLVVIGGAASWAYYQGDQLTEKQKMFLILLVIGTVIGFAILLTTGPMGIGFW